MRLRVGVTRAARGRPFEKTYLTSTRKRWSRKSPRPSPRRSRRMAMAGLCDRCMEREARSTSDLFCDQCEAEMRIADLTRQREEATKRVESFKRLIQTQHGDLGAAL